MKKITNNKGIETLIFAETFEFEAYDQIKKLINFEAYENAKVRSCQTPMPARVVQLVQQ